MNANPFFIRADRNQAFTLLATKQEYFVAKFEKKIIRSEDCWKWTGVISSNGYGRIEHKGKHLMAHRVSFLLNGGIIPQGMILDHLCRNRGCVNPNHLRVVSCKENVLCGENQTASKSRQVNCLKGHPLSGKNLGIDKRNHRYCKKCRAKWQSEYMQREKHDR